MEILKGKPCADAICADVLERVKKLKDKKINPCLAIIRVGERADDIFYENSAQKRMDNCGICVKKYVYSEDISTEELEENVRSVRNDNEVHGILLFMPLPKHIDSEKIKAAISSEKDVDCLCRESLASVFIGEKDCFAPCTPGGVMALLHHYNIDISGKNVVVLGRSLVVGKPLAMLLLSENATVTICHSRTKDLKAICSGADILIAAIGRARMVNSEYIKPGAIVIDVGINEDENGNMCGDVDFESACLNAGFITPVPGGVGSTTTAILAMHVALAAEKA